MESREGSALLSSNWLNTEHELSLNTYIKFFPAAWANLKKILRHFKSNLNQNCLKTRWIPELINVWFSPLKPCHLTKKRTKLIDPNHLDQLSEKE